MFLPLESRYFLHYLEESVEESHVNRLSKDNGGDTHASHKPLKKNNGK
jgi:hypothetical protein